MGSMKVALVPDGPKRLEVGWQGSYKNLTLTLDGAPVLTVPTVAELKAGREVRTQAGTIGVQLKTPAFGRELWLTLDGRPIPKTAADPAKRLEQSYGVLYAVAALNILFGGAAAYLDLDPLKDMGLGWISMVFGVVLAALALAVHRRRSVVALSLAAGLLALDTAAGLAAAMGGGHSPTQGIVMRVFILIWVCRGFGPLRDLRAQQRPLASGGAVS